jgi:hypothetical protein
VPAKKKIKERIIREASSTSQEGSAQQNYVPPFGEILAPPSYYGGVPMQAWGSGAAIPPTKFCGAQRSLWDRQFEEDRKMVPRLKIPSISPKEKYF